MPSNDLADVHLIGSYPAQYRPGANLTFGGVFYEFQENQTYDNFVSQGQDLSFPAGQYSSINFFASAESSPTEGQITISYRNESEVLADVSVPPWWQWVFPPGGDIVLPFYFTNESANYNKSHIYQRTIWLDSSKELMGLRMPDSDAGNRLHVFAATLTPVSSSANGTGTQLEVVYARSTKKYAEVATTQIYEVTISNVDGQAWVTANDSVQVTIESEGVVTTKAGIINRLRPGDRVIVQVEVENKPGVEVGTVGVATARLTSGAVNVTHDFEATFGIAPYESTYESIFSHESPDWFNNAKFGIFIHWGLYSIPAWGNTGSNETYAEWYWWNLNGGPDTSDRTYEYHLENYGPDFVYDDFIANFSTTGFDAKDWVDLFADAGATYFVHVSKHHDGYALFDLPANVSNRTSVALFPHRDFIQETFAAAETYQPQLHRAVYYSLPEFFHPDYEPYGFGRWPGGNATNPFTNETLPYAGYVPIDDYVRDLILPEMQTLASLGTEIMWCDIGGPNLTTEFAAEWYNDAIAQNRQVVMNNRCGVPGDFDTPEYATISVTQQRKWESSAGSRYTFVLNVANANSYRTVDPFSYGYNRATPPEGYMNASTIITNLVDIVSKNGNYLLDIGPVGNGSVVDIEAQHLRQAGAWIKDHGEAIFNTTSWFITPQEGDDVRFTTTTDAFYILVMNQLNNTLTLTSPIPWIEGDVVTVVGGDLSGTTVSVQSVTVQGQPALQLTIDKDIQTADQWTWVFKVSYFPSAVQAEQAHVVDRATQEAIAASW
ncbi:hypothetical protein E8E14_013034 [Neopestalotiopsis sp. 37M]|nr:hypothetical protein E8E14_013034 [Neopestalotiopsis sp. 37M]